jgi:hypothetical protein
VATTDDAVAAAATVDVDDEEEVDDNVVIGAFVVRGGNTRDHGHPPGGLNGSDVSIGKSVNEPA